jgi:hypothetical protein
MNDRKYVSECVACENGPCKISTRYFFQHIKDDCPYFSDEKTDWSCPELIEGGETEEADDCCEDETETDDSDGETPYEFVQDLFEGYKDGNGISSRRAYIEQSVKKWADVIGVLDALRSVTDNTHCPLCREYQDDGKCYECPVCVHTGLRSCYETPYEDFTRKMDEVHEAAEAEKKFLEEL